jgi:hypothetical protein
MRITAAQADLPTLSSGFAPPQELTRGQICVFLAAAPSYPGTETLMSDAHQTNQIGTSVSQKQNFQ